MKRLTGGRMHSDPIEACCCASHQLIIGMQGDGSSERIFLKRRQAVVRVPIDDAYRGRVQTRKKRVDG